MMKGVAPIRQEYLKKFLEDETNENITELNHEVQGAQHDEGTNNEAMIPEESSAPTSKKRRRGQNKNREQFNKKREPASAKLCKSIQWGQSCNYGASCKFMHDITDFMSTKPADISSECYNYKAQGKCSYSYACRFASAHTKEVDGQMVNLCDESVTPESNTRNALSSGNLTLLRKHKFNFEKSKAATAAAKKVVEEIVKKNVEENCVKKVRTTSISDQDLDGTKTTPDMDGIAIIVKDDVTTPGIDGAAIIVKDGVTTPGINGAAIIVKDDVTTPGIDGAAIIVKDGVTTPDIDVAAIIVKHGVTTPGIDGAAIIVKHGVTTPGIDGAAIIVKDGVTTPDVDGAAIIVKDGVTTVGPVTDEDQFAIKPGEKKTVDFNNKLYLAPLTTVGNLPFRRICKTLGADITCGEMALATKLLQGVPSEWALVKRHSSEDVFGVQICGAFADSMTKCTQLLNETCDLDFIDINVGCPIDMIFDQGAGSALMRRVNRFHEMVHSMVSVSDVPITAKIRTGISESKNTAHLLLSKMKGWGLAMTTIHGRSREQRYTKQANWSYIDECAKMAAPMPLYGGGDILSYEDYNAAMKTNVSGVMIARGALIKPWIFTEIKEQRHWDISSKERLDILRDYTNYGLEHWGSDHQGVENTRRFLLEWLSFLHRYIPVGLLEHLPQKINERPSPYFGRDDLETLFASPVATDWVKITEMLLGPVPEGFFFIPKHKANAYG